MNRRDFLTALSATALTYALPRLPQSRPNVLFISIDDLAGDYKALGAITPNLDALLSQSVQFSAAQCPGPICGPSRTATLTGLNPTTTGIYENGLDFRFWYPDLVTLPQYFRLNGYWTAGSGKVFHPSGQPLHDIGLSWDSYPFDTFNTKPHPETNINGYDRGSPWYWRWDWQARPEPPDSHVWSDTLNTDVVIDMLNGLPPEPWFLALGNVSPHIPFYAPQQFFDNRGVTLPPVITDDLSDCGALGQRWARRIGMPYQWVADNSKWGDALCGYLACVSFMDWQIGRVLDTLWSSPYRDNALIVLWSDHGQHLGTKEHWGKDTLWGESATVPFAIAGPGIVPGIVTQPVGLVDLYPTLCDLTGLPTPPGLDGVSLTPLIRGEVMDTHALTTYGPGNYSVRVGEWRYIVYTDGGEELYNIDVDPHEWHNVVADYPATVAWLRRWLPVEAAEPVQEYEIWFPWASKTVCEK